MKREKQGGKTVKTYEPQPRPPYQRLLECPQILEAPQARLRAEHARLDPFALNKATERKLKNFSALGTLDRASMKP